MTTIQELLKRDQEEKGGPYFNDESARLTAIYSGRARDLTIQALKAQGQGDPEQRRYPFQSKLLQRLVKTIAVVWAQPPVRLLSVEGERLPEAQAQVQTFHEVYQRSRINRWLKSADRWRSFLGQVVLYCSPSPRARVEPRLFQPHHVARWPDPSSADDMSLDQAVALKVRDDPKEPRNCVWHLWEQEGPDMWTARRVNGASEEIDGPDALYKGRQPPFMGPPFLQLYDELPEGRAWLQIDETRSTFAVGQSVVMNEIAYLLKQEAHTPVVVTGSSSKRSLPEKWGPGEVWSFEDDQTRVNALSLNPKLLESIGVSRHFLELFASGEGLPADYFLATRRYETGASGRLRLQDLDARRQDQLQDAIHAELELFEIVRAIHNAHREHGPPLGESVRLSVELAKPWFPVDVDELQTAWDFDLQRGLGSPIDYLMERHRIGREQAIAMHGRVREDLEAYPVERAAPAAAPGDRQPGLRGRPPVDDAIEGPDREAIAARPHRSSPIAVAT